MKQKLINSQLSNFKTYEMWKRRMLTLAENVFNIKYLPLYISKAYINKQLLRKGSIAFFVDEVLGLLALPYTILGKLDVYGRPTSIEVNSQNGYRKILKSPDEFVIMYDNNGQYPLWLDILQMAERLALSTRVSDINVAQQKTPRFWKTKTENVESIKKLVNNVDAFENVVIAYDDLDLDDTTMVLAPAPYVADKIDMHKKEDWNDFLQLIGIANASFQKKERNIVDEVASSQGGTVASRFSRFDPRQTAIEEINEKFGYILKRPLEVEYYDGLPTTEKEQNIEESEELEDEF